MNRQLANRDRAILDEQGRPSGLSLTVVFTSVAATLAALRQAGELAHELGARIRILVAQVVPYPLPIDRPPVSAKFNFRHLRTVCVNGTVDTQVDVRLCRDAYLAITEGLYAQSIVLIGGRKRWWPTREQHLAKRLSLIGHHVIFVPLK